VATARDLLFWLNSFKSGVQPTNENCYFRDVTPKKSENKKNAIYFSENFGIVSSITEDSRNVLR
jgi:hypothetical protein